jgi:hypothetical protein
MEGTWNNHDLQVMIQWYKRTGEMEMPKNKEGLLLRYRETRGRVVPSTYQEAAPRQAVATASRLNPNDTQHEGTMDEFPLCRRFPHAFVLGRLRRLLLLARYRTTPGFKIHFFLKLFDFFPQNFKMRRDGHHDDRHEQVCFYYIECTNYTVMFVETRESRKTRKTTTLQYDND